MRFTLLNSVYDDRGNERAKKFFQKAVRWIRESTSAGRENWRKVLGKRYSQYLVGSIHNTTQDLCESCSGNCSNCYVKNDKGEEKMSVTKRIKEEISKHVLDNKVEEAFNTPNLRPEVKEEPSFEAVYQVTKDGKLEQTRQSLKDEKVFWEEQAEETIEESDNLSEDEKILAAFKR